jgi:hypothetical protein
MANNCWNWVSFNGDKKNLDKLEKVLKIYDKTNYFTEFGDIVLGRKPQDYKSQPFDFYYKYGTKWWDFDISRDSDTSLVINGDSAWSPPLELTKRISSAYKLEVQHEFEEAGNDFAGIHKYKNGEVLEQKDMTYQMYQFKENPEGFWDDINMHIECTESWEEFLQYIDKEVLNIMSEKDLKDLVNEYKQATGNPVPQD